MLVTHSGGSTEAQGGAAAPPLAGKPWKKLETAPLLGEESSSDESEYASASDGLETPKSNDEQYLGLPSEDSEDDDYNPYAPDVNEDVKQESSSSDFTSDSKDLGAALDDNIMSSEDVEGPKSTSLDDSKPHRGSGEQSSRRGQKKHSLKDEFF
ncbi:hypothetical protein L3X38_036212 [Prunus dulcis]|uniref:Uncharacterized protein n=1 Tax=Prunus dulcis TaxID=3755 RepID=A0AAD4V0Z6_PRUDU|nr:hypothetical protein L3X38_036212 [Prunus dulcis]